MTEKQKELYTATAKRLARMGANDPTAQVVALAEEIEHYRDKIQVMDDLIDKQGAQLRELKLKAPRPCTINTDSLPQFQTDYTISWDAGSGDCTCVIITKISRDGTRVVGESIGTSHEDSGCISLRQAVEAYEERKRL